MANTSQPPPCTIGDTKTALLSLSNAKYANVFANASTDLRSEIRAEEERAEVKACNPPTLAVVFLLVLLNRTRRPKAKASDVLDCDLDMFKQSCSIRLGISIQFEDNLTKII